MGGVGVLVALAYGAAVGALALAGIAGSTPAWWPEAGVGPAAAVVAPRRLWPALAVALFAAYAHPTSHPTSHETGPPSQG